MANPVRGAIGAGGSFNPYSAGKKRYGGGRSMPNLGATGNVAGYNERDAKAKARKEALIRRASSKPGQASSRPGNA